MNVVKMIGILLLVVVVILIVIIVINNKEQKRQQALMVKSDEDLIGIHYYVPRNGKEDVDCNLYIHEDGERHPLIINLHGGAFIAGDADTLDSQSDRISKQWNSNVVTVNYKLAKGGYDISYGTEEVIDTVQFFIKHADEYGIDTDRIFVLGYSAGAYHAMAAVLKLKENGIDIAGQIICYGFIKEVNETYLSQDESFRRSLCPSLFILADNDPISEGSLIYQKSLEENGIDTEVKKYDDSRHGFIEENNQEYEVLKAAGKSPEQEDMARDAEKYIFDWINRK